MKNAIALFVLIVLSLLQAGCARSARAPAVVARPDVLPGVWQSAGVSTAEAADILRQVLELAVVKRHIGDLNLLSDQTRIPILEANAAPLPLPRFPGVEFYFISSIDAARLAEEQNSVLMVFSVWAVKRNGNDLVVTLSNGARLPERLKGTPMLIGSELTVTFTKTPAGWRVLSERMTIV